MITTMRIYFYALCLITFSACSNRLSTKRVWRESAAQTSILLREAQDRRLRQNVFPRTVQGDSLKLVSSNDWTSGFFPGMLWFYYRHTGSERWKQAAAEFTSLMSKEPFNGNSHDVGFKVYDSYGNGFELTSDSTYRSAVIQGARTLIKRFNPRVGCIKSWDNQQWQFPVIIDNMMNLELLFEASRLSGDTTFYHVAVTHALTTLANHFRPDNSSYHVVSYDTLTGKAVVKTTHQGYASESSWARGQAWGLYGFTMCFRETRDLRFLRQAQNIAAYINGNPTMPADRIPYWDYSIPDTARAPRDASAAAITASALYELSTYVDNGKPYRQEADRILNSLTKYYRSIPGGQHGFVLEHSTGHKPANSEIDVPLIYADYYFLEALLRKAGKF